MIHLWFNSSGPARTLCGQPTAGPDVTILDRQKFEYTINPTGEHQMVIIRISGGKVQ